MGQQQLNCKNNAKVGGKQIQTEHTNAGVVMRTYQPDPLDSQVTKKETNRSQVDSYTLKTSAADKKKIPSAMLAQHENILKANYTNFKGAVKRGNKWIQKPGKSLAEIVEGRYNTNKHFPQPQVVALIQSLVYALAYMEKHNCRHHDFYPSNIYYHQGIFKISNPIMVQCSAYTLTHNRERFSFLAPELIAELIQDTPESQIAPEVMYKADLFAIGMILLEFCTLEQSSECFDQENYSLVDQVIRTRLAATAKLYSPTIADCIAQMLKYDVEERISPQQLAVAIFLQAPEEKGDQEKPTENKSNGEQQSLPPLPPKQQQNPQHVQNQYLMVPGQQMGVPPMSKQGVPIGGNNIAVPTPNYQYSHIGPENQSLLSAGTLHNKLKVIEKINETPQEEEESEGIPSHLSVSGHQGQRIIVHQNQQVPNNPQIQQLHQQIQQKRTYTGQPPSDNYPQHYRPQPPQQQKAQRPPQPMQPPQHLQPPQRDFQPPRQQPPPPQNYRPSEGIQQRGSVVRDYQPGGAVREYQPGPPPAFQNGTVPDYHPMRSSQNYHSVGLPQSYHPQMLSQSNPKPNSPPISQNLFQKPPSPIISGKTPESSNQSSSLTYEDRMLLMKPTYYEVHGKGNSEPVGDSSYGSLQYSKPVNTNVSSNNFDFNYTEKYTKKDLTSDLPDYGSLNFKHQSSNEVDRKFDYPVSNYQSSQKYSLASDYSSTLPGRANINIGKDSTVDENGETLEQRVDRILQISRSIK